MRSASASEISDEYTRLSAINQIAKWIWLRGRDLNPRPSGYEPDELPGCSTPRLETYYVGLAREGKLKVRWLIPPAKIASAAAIITHVGRRSFRFARGNAIAFAFVSCATSLKNASETFREQTSRQNYCRHRQLVGSRIC